MKNHFSPTVYSVQGTWGRGTRHVRQVRSEGYRRLLIKTLTASDELDDAGWPICALPDKSMVELEVTLESVE